jgi:hypothetical protein
MGDGMSVSANAWYPGEAEEASAAAANVKLPMVNGAVDAVGVVCALEHGAPGLLGGLRAGVGPWEACAGCGEEVGGLEEACREPASEQAAGAAWKVVAALAAVDR